MGEDWFIKLAPRYKGSAIAQAPGFNPGAAVGRRRQGEEMQHRLKLGLAAVSLGALMVAAPLRASAQQPDPAIKIGAGDLGGVVKSSAGPEAGVWVIAETTDLPTKFAKMVVTDDKGRYVLPELPRRSTRSGCAATGSSTPSRWTPRPASSLTSRR